MKTICYTLFAVFTIVSSSDVVKYDNFTLYRVIPKNVHEVNILVNFQDQELFGYDFWTHPKSVGASVNILVSPDERDNLKEVINKMHYEVLTENLQENIDKEARLNKANDKASELGITWDRYYRVDEIYDWLRQLSYQYPQIVSLIEVGTSFQGRPILGVKLSFRPENDRRSVWLDSLIHAREWITGATNTFILNQLLTSTDPEVRRIAETHDWYIVPVLNPDGYEFTHTNNRLWRKTRRPYSTTCFGADPNRNWGYRWNTGGASNLACSDTYAGPAAFSEIETFSVSQYLESISQNLIAYISFHSFSQLMLLPYGHTTEHLDNYNQVRAIALKGAAALARRYGTDYIVGNVAEAIYVATGSSGDYMKGTYQVPVAITYELRDKGQNGFVLPPDQILPTGLETLDSLITIIDETDRMLQNETV